MSKDKGKVCVVVMLPSLACSNVPACAQRWIKGGLASQTTCFQILPPFLMYNNTIQWKIAAVQHTKRTEE